MPTGYSMNSQEVMFERRRKIARSKVPTHGEATRGDALGYTRSSAPRQGDDIPVAFVGLFSMRAYRYFRETGQPKSRSRRDTSGGSDSHGGSTTESKRNAGEAPCR